MANKEDGLRALGCVVKGKLGSLQDECSACGVLLDLQHGVILCHGSILTELCLKDKSLYLQVKNGSILHGLDLKGSKFEALIDSRWSSHFTSGHASPAVRESSYSLLEAKQLPTVSPSFISMKCHLLYAFRNEDFFKAVARIMPSYNWTFLADSPDDSSTKYSQSEQELIDTDENSICFDLLSYFLLLKIEHPHVNSQKEKNVSVLKVPSLRRNNCFIGDVAEIVSTPFGGQNPAVFFNTYSRGVVCNVSGPQGCWILTDARCIPGSEGGPLFTGKDNQTRYLTGIVAASLCWKNKEWVGFSLACSLNSIYSSLDFHLKNEQIKLSFDSQEWIEKKLLNGLSLDMEESAIDHNNPLLSSTVMVKVGSTWGSGVIINKEQGIILTCSHVVKDSGSFHILIKPFQDSPLFRATLIYSNSGSLQRPYDIAVLKCSEATSGLHSQKVPRICTPKIGEKVYVVGHALFCSDLNLQPSFCAGVISKVITFKAQPVMIQTTCAVHPGTSGGPLLNSHGELAGIVVCNTVDKGSNSSYPHINMSIPAVSIWHAVHSYVQTGDSCGFSKLEISELSVKRLWTLDSCVLDQAEHFGRSKL